MMMSGNQKKLIRRSDKLNDGRVIRRLFGEIEVIEDNELEKYKIISPDDRWFCNIYIPSESISGCCGTDYFEDNIFKATEFTADMNTMLQNTFQSYKAMLQEELKKYERLSMTLFYGLLAAEEIYIADISPIWGIYVKLSVKPKDIEKTIAIYETVIDKIIDDFPGSRKLETISIGQKPSNGYLFGEDEIDINSLTLQETEKKLLIIMKEQSIDDINTDLVTHR